MKNLSTNNDLVVVERLDTALVLLNEAKTIQDSHRVMAMAKALEVYGREQKVSDSLIDKAHAIHVYALAKLGEMLKATERNSGERGQFAACSDVEQPAPPTLTDLGIDRKVSMRAQQVADLPKKTLDAVVLRKTPIGKAIKDHKKQKDRAARAEIAANLKPTEIEGVDIKHCSMEDLLKSQKGTLDAIITDPPYGKEYISLYEELARLSVLALKKTGILAVMCGQFYLPEILPAMARHIPYRWALAYLTPGGQSPQIWPKKVNTFWKPILLFGSVNDWIGDVIKSDVNDNDKRFHDWGQAEIGIARLVEALTNPGDLVCDPFLGGGTTAVVCAGIGRRFVGADKEGEAIATTRRRLSS